MPTMLHTAAAIVALMTVATATTQRCRFTPPPGRKYNTYANRSDVVPNFHIIAHTHDDLGWIVNPDEAYSGVNNGIYHAGAYFVVGDTLRLRR